MDWLKAKALAVYGWARTMLDYVIDPPPAAIKWYILGTLVVAIGGGVILAPWFAPSQQKPAAASPPAGIVVSVPKPRSEYLTPLKTLKPQPPTDTVKAVDATTKGKTRAYRRPKCSTVLC